jgi:VWFA-related protein
MRYSILCLIVFGFLFQQLYFVSAQQPTQQPAQQPTQQQSPAVTPAPQSAPSVQEPPEDALPQDVVRITTTLVQVDAVVVDKNGNPVMNLKPEDFRVLEDGKERTITNFSHVSVPVTNAATVNTPIVPANKNTPGIPPIPPAKIRPEQIRRTIALVADDLGLSFESTVYVRQALKKFVDQQMQPGDLVAIIRTSAGSGALQQFTTDKRLLHAAIDRINWYPMGRSGAGAFTPVGVPTSNPGIDSEYADEMDTFRRNVFSVGTLGSVGYVITGLRELPGRKSVVLVSDGITIFNRVRQTAERGAFSLSDRRRREFDNSTVFDSIRRLTDLANRASVVIYTLDARGLQTLGITAADDLNNNFFYSTDVAIESRLSNLRESYYLSQDGLNFLAAQTGGLFLRGTNDLAGAVKKIVDDQLNYYLIGFEPDEKTFSVEGRKAFHRIKVEVKKPGLRVRSRTGFYGISDEEIKKAPVTREQQLIAALNSPFSSGAINLNLTSVFLSDPGSQAFMKSLIHINLRDLTLTQQANGDYTTVIDVAETTHDENGLSIDRFARSDTLRVKAADYEAALRDGVTYTILVPIKKPGAYQLRLVVRDEASKRIGSASQFVEIPDLKKKRLTLSGISLSGSFEKGGDVAALSQASAALRKLRQGMVLDYGYAIYNAKTDSSTGRPDLTTQIKLFRDGQEIFAGQVQPLTSQKEKDGGLFTGGSLRIREGLKPGEYVLQAIVSDLRTKEKYRTATQWMNFEVVK